MAFLLAIPAGIIVYETADVVMDKLAAASASIHSFAVNIKRKIVNKHKEPEEKKEYSEDYQRIKKKYRK